MYGWMSWMCNMCRDANGEHVKRFMKEVEGNATFTLTKFRLL